MASSLKFAELWQRLGHRVVVCCMGSESSVEVVSPMLVIHRRKDWFLKDPLNFGISLGFTGYVRKLIRAEKPDAVVYNKILFWSSFGIPWMRLTGQRVLLLTDALVGITWWPRGRFPKMLAAIAAWTMGWLILLCVERVVFFHPQPEKVLRRLRVARKSQVIPTGIDVAAYPPRPAQETAVPGQVTVTYVGRLESVKGVDDFLAAVVPLKRDYGQLHVRVVGWYAPGHPLVEKYRTSVEFTGLRSDIPHVLSETDVFVMPSYSEGLSNALMEAMASTCACVASEVGGNAFLLQNGVSGFLFPAGDREALRAHMRRLLDDPHKRRAMAAAGRQRIEQLFAWERVSQQYRVLFDEWFAAHPA